MPAFEELHELYGELRRDLDELGGATLDESGVLRFPPPSELSQIGRRSLVRGIFAFVEGVSWSLKQAALAYHRESGRGLLSLGDVPALDESSLRRNTDGSTGSPRIRTGTLPNARAALRLFARAYGAQFEVPTSGSGWQSLVRSARVRNRLMHPKLRADLDVSDAEVAGALAAAVWFQEQIEAVMLRVVASLDGDLRTLQHLNSASDRDTSGS